MKKLLVLLFVLAFSNCSTKSNPIIESPDNPDLSDPAKVAALQNLERKLTEHIWIAGSGVEENTETGEKSTLYYFKAVIMEFNNDNVYFNDSRGHGRWEIDAQNETIRLLNLNTDVVEAEGTLDDNTLTITWRQAENIIIVEEFSSN